MIYVKLGGSLRSLSDHGTSFCIDAKNIYGLIGALKKQCPELKSVLEAGVVVAVGNQIHRDSWLQAIPDGSAVTVLPKMAGG